MPDLTSLAPKCQRPETTVTLGTSLQVQDPTHTPGSEHVTACRCCLHALLGDPAAEMGTNDLFDLA